MPIHALQAPAIGPSFSGGGKPRPKTTPTAPPKVKRIYSTFQNGPSTRRVNRLHLQQRVLTGSPLEAAARPLVIQQLQATQRAFCGDGRYVSDTTLASLLPHVELTRLSQKEQPFGQYHGAPNVIDVNLARPLPMSTPTHEMGHYDVGLATTRLLMSNPNRYFNLLIRDIDSHWLSKLRQLEKRGRLDPIITDIEKASVNLLRRHHNVMHSQTQKLGAKKRSFRARKEAEKVTLNLLKKYSDPNLDPRQITNAILDRYTEAGSRVSSLVLSQGGPFGQHLAEFAAPLSPRQLTRIEHRLRDMSHTVGADDPVGYTTCKEEARCNTRSYALELMTLVRENPWLRRILRNKNSPAAGGNPKVGIFEQSPEWHARALVSLGDNEKRQLVYKQALDLLAETTRHARIQQLGPVMLDFVSDPAHREKYTKADAALASITNLPATDIQSDGLSPVFQSLRRRIESVHHDQNFAGLSGLVGLILHFRS